MAAFRFRPGRFAGYVVHGDWHPGVVGIAAGADVSLFGISVATGEQEFDQSTLQIHAAGHAKSDLLFKNALLGKARTIFSGLIKVAPDAQRTDA